jgi:hypothetical protein
MASPLMSYDSVTSDPNRLAKSKNFTMFYRDLAANQLPQWMFITPNMSMFSQPPPQTLFPIPTNTQKQTTATTHP